MRPNSRSTERTTRRRWRSFSNWLRSHRSRPRQQNRLGKVFLSQEQFAEAEAAFRRALAIEPEYVAAIAGLGSSEFALGRFEEALGQFDVAIEIDPSRSEAHLQRGRALEALGRQHEALAAYFRALEFAPNSVDTSLRVATLQLARISRSRPWRGSIRWLSKTPINTKPVTSEDALTSP